MINTVFQRREVKFLVDPWQRELLERAFEAYMAPDAHGESTICNVYYDTPDYRLVRRSLEGPVYKEKLRLRSYGPAGKSGEVFVELKKKYKGIVCKRRVALPQDAAAAFLAGAPLPEESQIGREIEYFRDFYAGLRPAVHLSYDRVAYFAKDDPNLRMTFDDDIRWRASGLTLMDAPGGAPLLASGQSLFEVKTAEAMPLWLAKALSRGGIRQTAFSKYGRAYESMLPSGLREGRVIRSA